MDLYFMLDIELAEELMKLPDEELGKMMRAIYFYKKEGKEPAWDGMWGILFNAIKRELV